MPLNTSPKAQSNSSNTPSRVITRQEVSLGRQSTSSARADALKARLTGSPAAAPVAPRPAGTSARREEMAKLQKYSVAPQRPPTPAGNQTTSARTAPTDLSAVAPPPSGLAAIQPPTAETAETKAAEATSAPLSPQFAALAREEQKIRKARLAFKAEQEAWKQEQAKYLPREALTSDPLKMLAEAGITPDKLVELQINQAAAQDPIQSLKDQVAALQEQLKGVTDPENGFLAKRDKEQYDQAIAVIRDDAKLLVDSNPSYGTIKSEGKTEDVVELITKVFFDEGITLDVEEAADLIEAKLTERLLKQYERLSQYEKIKAKFGKPAETPAEAIQPQPSAQRSTSPTLTNAGASTRPLSARDRAVLQVQARIDAMRGR